MTVQRFPRLVAALATAAAVLAACSTTDASTTATSNSPPTSAAAPTKSIRTTSTPTLESATPTSVPPIPDGIYRMSLTINAILAGGGQDTRAAGTWTLTIKNRTYTLACRWIDTTGIDCGDSGHNDGDYIVETGPVRGDDTTLWLASDLTAVAKLNGCKPGECGVPDPYQFRWKLDGTDLELSDFVGFDGNAGLDLYHDFTLVRWKKIR